MDYYAHTKKFLLSTSGLFLALAILTLSQFGFSNGGDNLILDIRSNSSSLRHLETTPRFSSSNFNRGINLVASVWSGYSDFTRAMAASISENIFVKPVNSFFVWWKNVLASFLSIVNSYKTTALVNWSNYLNKSVVSTTTNNNVSSVPAIDREQLKAELKAELLKELSTATKTSAVVPRDIYATPDNGVVVIPSSGDAIVDVKTKEGISSMFSDPVKVRFDPSGRAGVITPVFKRNISKDYLFLLTPIQK
jgi:hypothetical protein